MRDSIAQHAPILAELNRAENALLAEQRKLQELDAEQRSLADALRGKKFFDRATGLEINPRI